MLYRTNPSLCLLFSSSASKGFFAFLSSETPMLEGGRGDAFMIFYISRQYSLAHKVMNMRQWIQVRSCEPFLWPYISLILFLFSRASACSVGNRHNQGKEGGVQAKSGGHPASSRHHGKIKGPFEVATDHGTMLWQSSKRLSPSIMGKRLGGGRGAAGATCSKRWTSGIVSFKRKNRQRFRSEKSSLSIFRTLLSLHCTAFACTVLRLFGFDLVLLFLSSRRILVPSDSKVRRKTDARVPTRHFFLKLFLSVSSLPESFEVESQPDQTPTRESCIRRHSRQRSREKALDVDHVEKERERERETHTQGKRVDKSFSLANAVENVKYIPRATMVNFAAVVIIWKGKLKPTFVKIEPQSARWCPQSP